MRGEEAGVILFVVIIASVLIVLGVVSIEPSKTVNVFTSLNITRSAPSVTLGINLAHSNVWSSTQNFQTILPNSDVSYQLGGSGLNWATVHSANYVGREGVDTIINLPTSGVINFETLGASAGTSILRMVIGEGAAQGGAGITSYEGLVFNPNSLGVGASAFAIGTSASSLIFFTPSSDTFTWEVAASPVLDVRSNGIVDFYNSLIPQTDLCCNIGTSSSRLNNLNFGNQIYGYFGSGDANPRIYMNTNPEIAFGAGGNSALDFNITRISGTELSFMFGHTKVFGLSNTGIKNTQGFQSLSGTITNPNFSVVVTLPVAEPDASYIPVCSPSTGNVILSVSRTSATQITVTSNVIGPVNFFCIVTHQ